MSERMNKANNSPTPTSDHRLVYIMVRGRKMCFQTFLDGLPSRSDASSEAAM